MINTKIIILSIVLFQLIGIKLSAQQHSGSPKSHTTTPRCMGLEKIKNPHGIPEDLKSELVIHENRISIIARSNGNTQKLHEELKNLGLHKGKIRENKIITGFLPLEAVEKLDSCKYLQMIMPSMRGKTNVGLTQSQAGSAMFSDHISNSLGLTGKGVRIGIISDNFNIKGGAEQSVLDGDLPGKGNPNGYNQEVVVLNESIGVFDEGRAMAELIHDIAPDAELYFWGGVNGYFEMRDGILALADAGCDIIVDDIVYIESPIYQDGLIAQAIDKVTADGVAYFTAAGNDGRSSYESEYRAAIEVTETDTIERFAYTTGKSQRLLTIPGYSQITITLSWDDPSIFSGNDKTPVSDLDLFLENKSTFETLASSINNNLQTRIPLERMSFDNFTSEPIETSLIIQKKSGESPTRISYRIDANFLGNYKVFERKKFFEQVEGQGFGTIYAASMAQGAISIGAADYRLSPEYGGTPVVESFSSYGGLPKVLDIHGNKIPLEIRKKPDVVAPDYVNTSFFGYDVDKDGFPNFSGTSAAAPNAAAIAALMLELKPDLTPKDIKEVLTSTALDMDDEATDGFDKGFDFASGYGFIQADKALATLTDKPMVYRVEMIDATSDTLINVIEKDEEIDLSNIETHIDLRLLSTNTSNIASVLYSDNNLLTHYDSETSPFLAVDSKNSLNSPWFAQSGAYDLKWFAFDSNIQKSIGQTNFSITNANFANPFAAKSNVDKTTRNVIIYPNPANKQTPLDIKIPGVSIISIALYNLLGVQVLKGNRKPLQISNLTEGIYIVVALDENGTSHRGKIQLK